MRILVKGGIWKNTEDEILKAAVMKYGKNQWARIASLLSRKSAKQCKARWYEWLDPGIKKTEWSREEEEKLLHLAKIMPCQWRTIAPIVGRTAAQCLEHYEKLLDAATNKDEEYDPSDDPRRLRPGEIDPNPEAKPARPDRVDMEEDEKEMLQEARARLANTKGKKAKRKAREKQLEEARRLASLQKKRELKAAGIPVGQRRKRRRGLDYNKETPYLHRPAPGFHSTASEREREIAEKEQPNFHASTLQKLEGERRDEIEEKARKKDIEKLKQRMEKAAPAAVMQINQINQAEASRRRQKLIIPSPQMNDQEVREIAKMAYEPEDGETENEATRDLLSRYDPTPTPHRGSAASGVPATPSIRGMERTPLRPDSIIAEAQNLVALTKAGTPLLGGENAPLHPSDFSGALPKKVAITTPNVLATPLRTPAPGSGMTPLRGSSDATPLRTPLRDRLNINEGSADFGEEEEGEQSRRQSDPKNILKVGLAALPKPREYNIVMPDLPDTESDISMSDIDPDTDTETTEDGSEMRRVRGSSSSVADAEDLDRQRSDLARSEQEQRLRLRSEVLKRDLPRPFRVNGAFAKTPKEIEAMARGDDTKLIQMAQEMIKHEMVMMMTNDAIQYPTKQVKPPAKINPQTWKFDAFAEGELKQAKKLLDREMNALNKTFGTYTDADYAETWLHCQDDLVYLPHVKKYTLNSMIKFENDKIRAVKHQFDVIKVDFKRQNKKAKALEKPVSVYLGGYQKVAETKEKAIHELRKKIAQIRIEIDCFKMLQATEHQAIPQRIEALHHEVEEQQKQEVQLQTIFANLVTKKTELLATLALTGNANGASISATHPPEAGADHLDASLPAAGDEHHQDHGDGDVHMDETTQQ